MTQDIIIDQLNKIFPPTNVALPKRFKSSGHCFGFAVSHAAFSRIGYKRWWESTLVKIATTRINAKTIKAPVKIPGSLSQQPVPLKDLADRVVNYVVPTQGQIISSEGGYTSQKNLLDPAQQLFDIVEVTDQKKSITHTIKHRVRIAGHLTQTAIETILDEKTISKTICLVHGEGHTINVHYEKNQWYVYDPNYDHTDEKSISKACPDKNALIAEVLSIVSNNLCFEIATFDYKSELNISAYEKLIEENPASLLRESGLHVIARYASEWLPKLLTQIEKNNAGKLAFMKAMHVQDDRGWTGLQMIADCAPMHLLQVITFLEKDPIGESALARAAAMVSQTGWTLLHTTAHHSPLCLDKLVMELKKTDTGKSALIKAIATETKPEDKKEAKKEVKKSETGLYAILRYAPRSFAHVATSLSESDAGKAALAKLLPQTIAQLEKTQEGQNALIDAMLTLTHNGWIGLHVMVHYLPKHLPQVIACLAKSEAGISALAKAIVLQKAGDWSSLHLIAFHVPEALPQVIACLAKSDAGKSALAKAMVIRNKEGLMGLHDIIRSPQLIRPLIECLEQSDNEKSALIQAFAAPIQIPDNTGLTELHALASFAPELLPQVIACFEKTQEGIALLARLLPKIIDMLKSTEQGNPDLVKIISARNNQGVPGLHLIVKNAPALLFPMITCLEKSAEGKAEFTKAMEAETKEGETGLYATLRHAPESFAHVTVSLSGSEAGKTILVKLLPQVIAQLEKTQAGQHALINAMLTPTAGGWIGLHIMAYHFPKHFSQMITCLAKSNAGISALVKAIVLQKEDNSSSLHLIALHAPEALAQLIACLANSDAGKSALTKAMAMRTKEGLMGLHAIILRAPQSIPALIACLGQSENERSALIQALTAPFETPNNTGLTGLHMLLNAAPELLPQILIFFDSCEEGRIALAKAMLTAKNDGSMGLHSIISLPPQSIAGQSASPNAMAAETKESETVLYAVLRYAPRSFVRVIVALSTSEAGKAILTKSFPQMIARLEKDNEGQNALINAMLTPTTHGWIGLHVMVHYLPKHFPQVLACLVKSDAGRSALVKTIGLRREDNSNSLHLIALHAPEALPQVIACLIQSDAGKSALADAVIMRNNEKLMVLHAIIRCSPLSLLPLMTCFEQTDRGKFSLIQAFAASFNMPDNIAVTGLQLLANHAPELLPRAIACLEEVRENIALLKHVLPDIITKLGNTEEGKAALIKIILAQNDKHSIGLHLIIEYTPASLPQLIDCLGKCAEGRAALAKAMLMRDQHGHMGWHVILTHFSQLILPLMEHFKQSENEKPALLQAFTEFYDMSKPGTTGLHILVGCAPELLPKVFTYFEEKENVALFKLLAKVIIALKTGEAQKAQVVKAFVAQDGNGFTVLHWIAWYAPTLLLPLINCLENSKKANAILANVLDVKAQNDYTLLALIVLNAPTVLPQILPYLDNSEEGRIALAKALIAQDKNSLTGLAAMMMYSPSMLPTIYSMMNKINDAEILAHFFRVVKQEKSVIVASSDVIGACEAAIQQIEKKLAIELKSKAVAQAEDVKPSDHPLLSQAPAATFFQPPDFPLPAFPPSAAEIGDVKQSLNDPLLSQAPAAPLLQFPAFAPNAAEIRDAKQSFNDPLLSQAPAATHFQPPDFPLPAFAPNAAEIGDVKQSLNDPLLSQAPAATLFQPPEFATNNFGPSNMPSLPGVIAKK